MTNEQGQKQGRIDKLRNWYGKYERPVSSFSLIGGFVFDAIFLKRVDLFWENFWVVLHLVVIAVCMVVVHALEKEEGADSGADLSAEARRAKEEALAKAAANPSKAHFWLVNIIQFTFGGVLSVFLVFYFRSSDITVSWPFLLILALAFWANEALKRSFVRLGFQVALLFLSIYCFSIFLVPVITHRFGGWMFLLSGFISLLAIGLFLLLIRYVAREEFNKGKKILFLAVVGVFTVVNLLYYTNIIPPIPLSLKAGGVYYALVLNPDGGYFATGEQPDWKNYFKLYPDFHFLEGQPVYVYSAVFSPPKLNVSIVHEWQRKDSETGKWVTTDKIPLRVVGGRDGGFRTYSLKRFNLKPGHWRVNVLTTRGQVIGSIRFNLIPSENLPKIIQEIN